MLCINTTEAKLETFEVQQVASLSICIFERFLWLDCMLQKGKAQENMGGLIQEVFQGSVYLQHL